MVATYMLSKPSESENSLARLKVTEELCEISGAATKRRQPALSTTKSLRKRSCIADRIQSTPELSAICMLHQGLRVSSRIGSIKETSIES